MARDDIEALTAFVVGIRDYAQNLVDSCNLFLKHLEERSTGVPEDPAIWDTLDWEQREKEETHFKYEMLRIDENNKLHRQLRMMLQQKKTSLKIGAYRYTLGKDKNVIFRSLIKEDSAK